MSIKLAFLHKTTFLPTNATYIGVHTTDDLNYGTREYSDPHLGTGTKLIALIKDLKSKNVPNIRALFDVSLLAAPSTLQEINKRLSTYTLHYDHPLSLNTKEGAKLDVPKSEEHKAAISESLRVAMVGNDNAVGNMGRPRSNTKWFNDGTNTLELECDSELRPTNPEYANWKLGKLKKKHPRLLQIQAENKKSSQTASNTSGR